MKFATLLIDIYSSFDKKKPVGVKGERVEITGDHGNALTVKSKTKYFTVNEHEIKIEQ